MEKRSEILKREPSALNQEYEKAFEIAMDGSWKNNYKITVEEKGEPEDISLWEVSMHFCSTGLPQEVWGLATY